MICAPGTSNLKANPVLVERDKTFQINPGIRFGPVWRRPFVCPGPNLPNSEKQKIETLIKQVANLKDAKFVRNGSSYNADSAAVFLRRKCQASESEVKTAQDFIDKVASFSATSGKPYLIRFKDGSESQSRDFLLAQLKKLDP